MTSNNEQAGAASRMGWGISILMEEQDRDEEPRREERPVRVRQEVTTTPRQRMVALLEERPGISFRELARGLGMASGSAQYHLSVLERQKRAWVERRRERQYLFAGKRPGEVEVRRLLVRARMDDLDRELVEAAVESGCQRVVLDLFEERVPRSTVQHRLRRLVEWGVLRETRRGRYLRYHAGELA